ncbi:ATP-binding protein [Mycolicibacterium mengxianglii]|uniref:ATP-binding protein n=1 Tax=Mycolicibacterium mengxianglii TaxID=2736649 RepID=UPI0018D10507|nr:adenylate/guanylate cyclase domain-containing protein [Mycolicibacterium mengxianglii]
MEPAGAMCRACGTQLRRAARFCDGCGTPAPQLGGQAEFKQVTVLFADVVGSMAIAAAVGSERLREMMTDIFSRAATINRRYGGALNQFTGDGIMALFGAPTALEDHAFRACLAALDIQEQMAQLAGDVLRRDGVILQLRVGLNSGRVIAGEIGSGPTGYTAIGEQVVLAQRMESVAPPGGVMLSESTARLVEHATMLEAPELVWVKGAQEPLPARRLLGAAAERERGGRREPTLVGRIGELDIIAGILDEAISGAGCVAGVVGPPGIGKSRVMHEAVTLAAGRGVRVFTVSCESHTREVPFQVVARLLRTVFGVSDLDGHEGRARVRARLTAADPEDLLLLDDLLGIGDPDTAPPAITSDARRRRLAALLKAAVLIQATPAMYVIEDAHWIDEVSESMFAELVTVVPQSRSLVLITYRPEYRGALSKTPGTPGRTISLAPLNPAETAALTAELLGDDPSVCELAARIAEQAAGNPFFVEEMVRDLAERSVLQGDRGSYLCRDDAADIGVPGTLLATIAARVDRLTKPAKHFLYAAAVIGARFGPELVDSLIDDTEGSEAVAELLQAELIDRVTFTPRPEYAFRHPLTRAVAYESQLRSDRAILHRRLAVAIEQEDPGSADENAALIAGHLEAAGDLRAAFDWHMRAGGWLVVRDVCAARRSWQRARQVADRLPSNTPDRTSMQIVPRTLLCGTVWRAGGTVADTDFDELRRLCTTAGDTVSLAIATAGYIMALTFFNRFREAAQVASELSDLLESIGDPTLTVALLFAAIYAKCEAGEMIEALRLADRVVDLADGDATKGNLILGSPLSTAIAMRGHVKMCLGMPGWLHDAADSIAMAAPLDPTSYVFALLWKYVASIPLGALPPNATAMFETAEALRIAEQTSDDFVLGMGRLSRGLALVCCDGPQRDTGLDLFTQARDAAVADRFSLSALTIVDPEFAMAKARTGDLDGAIEMARSVVDGAHESGDMIWLGRATAVLVELLLRRSSAADLFEAQAVINRLAAVPTDPGFVLHELPLLRSRALLARAHDDEDSCRNLLEHYRAKAAAAGFEALVAAADATVINSQRGKPRPLRSETRSSITTLTNP